MFCRKKDVKGLALKNWVDYYNVKIIETPTSIEIWEYIDKPVIYTVKVNNENKKDTIIENDKDLEIKTSASEHYDALKRKQKHYEKMRWEIARIVDCNFDDKTKFMTLTFKDNIDDKNYKQKAFFKSQNLIMPKVDLLKIDDCLDFSNDDVVYTKTYSRKSPEFNSLGLSNYLSFTESSVRYTKIRKESKLNDNNKE